MARSARRVPQLVAFLELSSPSSKPPNHIHPGRVSKQLVTWRSRAFRTVDLCVRRVIHLVSPPLRLRELFGSPCESSIGPMVGNTAGTWVICYVGRARRTLPPCVLRERPLVRLAHLCFSLFGPPNFGDLRLFPAPKLSPDCYDAVCQLENSQSKLSCWRGAEMTRPLARESFPNLGPTTTGAKPP